MSNNVEVNVLGGPQSEHTNQTMSKRKIIIIATIIIAIIILLCVILQNRKNSKKINPKALAEEEKETINLDIEIKQTTTESYKCLLTFTSNDANNKIKQIEYPKEEGKDPQIITVANAEGKEKIGIDYEFALSDINKTFKVTTQNGDIVSKRTYYTVTYDPNDGINAPEKETIFLGTKTIILPIEQPTKEGEVFWGWSEDKSAVEATYLKNSNYINTDNKEEINLYAVWDSENNGILRYIASSEVNTSGIYSSTALGVKYNYEVTYLTPSNIRDYGGSYDTGSNTYTLNDLELGTAEGIEINGESAQAMAVLKCDGNLIINGTVTTSTYSETSPSGVTGDVTKIKGMFIYCSGELINNGTITQTARGTYTPLGVAGENLYLWSKNSTYENYTVPATGATGGNKVHTKPGGYINGESGSEGINRKTGGGGSGGAVDPHWDAWTGTGMVFSGAGSSGSSYTGGSGRWWCCSIFRKRWSI